MPLQDPTPRSISIPIPPYNLPINNHPSQGHIGTNAADLDLITKIERGFKYFEDKEYLLTIMHLLTVDLPETHPQYNNVKYKLGMSFYERKHFENAELYLKKVSENFLFAETVNFTLGIINARLKKSDVNTIHYLTKVPVHHTSYNLAQRYLAAIYSRQGNPSQAIAHYKNVENTSSSQHFFYAQVHMAHEYSKLNQLQKVKEHITNAAKILPNLNKNGVHISSDTYNLYKKLSSESIQY
jgi:tetratricopeptide (TPR) repeat protein